MKQQQDSTFPHSSCHPSVAAQPSSSYVSSQSPNTAQTRHYVPWGGSFSQPKSVLAGHIHFKSISDRIFLLDARADQGYNWPEQLRSRAESSVTSGSRPSFSFATGMGSSPPRASGSGGMPSNASGGGGVGSGGGVGVRPDRIKSVSEIRAPVVDQPRPAPQPHREARPKPDRFQERILKGDFYMD